MSRCPSPLRLSALALATVGLTASGLALAAPASAVPDRLVQGVAVDQHGEPLLDVTVQAFADDGDDEAEASDRSYENVTADGDPQHGYFALHVGTRGTYTVTLSKKGYYSETRDGIRVSRRSPVASLGEVELVRKPQETSTAARPRSSSVGTSEQAKVQVSVSCDDTACDGLVPTGRVEVRDGRRVLGAAALKRAHDGTITVTVRKLPRGSYDLKAVYGGSDLLEQSSSRTFGLTVGMKGATRPNARAWIG